MDYVDGCHFLCTKLSQIYFFLKQSTRPPSTKYFNYFLIQTKLIKTKSFQFFLSYTDFWYYNIHRLSLSHYLNVTCIHILSFWYISPSNISLFWMCAHNICLLNKRTSAIQISFYLHQIPFHKFKSCWDKVHTSFYIH